MPLLIIIVILLIRAGAGLYDELCRKAPLRSSKELDNLLSCSVGKSKSEVRGLSKGIKLTKSAKEELERFSQKKVNTEENNVK